MGPFDFLNNIKNTMSQYFQPGMNQVQSTLNQFFPTRSNNLRIDKPSKSPDLSSVIKAASNTPSAADFQSGFSKFGADAPVATASPAFAQAAQKMPANMDPYLPAVIALMETGGGAKTVAPNNVFNISGMQNGREGFVSYPDFSTALLGGDNGGVQSQGFMGTLLNGPAYSDFRSSGNLGDFFNSYTPPGPAYGNPSLEELLGRYQALRALFPGM